MIETLLAVLVACLAMGLVHVNRRVAALHARLKAQIDCKHSYTIAVGGEALPKRMRDIIQESES